jgi:flagellar basal body rod protein FlgG
MNYGLYLSAGGALAGLHRQDVIANNLANVNTVGFKPHDVYTGQRLPARLEDAGAMIEPQLLLEQLTGGVTIQPTAINLSQGPLLQSGNDLDLAVEGDGFFLVRDHRAGDQLRLTRDGRFTLNSAGELIMTGTGLRVMSDQDQPIRLNSTARIQIDADGRVVQNGAVVAKLALIAAPGAEELTKVCDNLMKVAAAALEKRQPATGRVLQHQLEGSGVDPVTALNQMIAASRAVAANVKLMQYHDHIMDQTVNTLGRVA